MDEVFKPCPDCGIDVDTSGPVFEREDTYFSAEGIVFNGAVRAKCLYCGWSTSYHKTVRECREEWNYKKEKDNEW